MSGYRTPDHSARVRDLEEEIERLHERIKHEDAETEEAQAELRVAETKLRGLHVQRGLLVVGVVAGVVAAGFVIFFTARSIASMPSHHHVQWGETTAFQNRCSSSEKARSNERCREEAEAECRGADHVKELASNETYHEAYDTQMPIFDDKGNLTGFSTQHHPAEYTYVYTYQCKAER